MVAFSHLSMIAFVILGLSMVRLMINFSALLAKNYNDDGDDDDDDDDDDDADDPNSTPSDRLRCAGEWGWDRTI